MDETQDLPPGWDETRVRRVIAHYDQQSDEEVVLEDERAFHEGTMIEVPLELVPVVRELIAEHEKTSHGHSE
jgi:hypothetical protein